MRIGVMLRSLDEKGGIGVYTENVVAELLRLDRRNHYYLYYQSAAHLGRFSHHSNVTERFIKGRNKTYWDQVAIPYACRQDGLDVIFHPKFTVPLLAPCKAVMVVHGADWFFPDQARYYKWSHLVIPRLMMPLYFKKCTTVISVSQLTTEGYRQVLNVPEDKIKTIYFGPARHFRKVTEETTLWHVRQRYDLPDRYILTLNKPLGDGRKNLGQIFKAYAGYHRRTIQQGGRPLKLVVGGQDCHQYRTAYGLADGPAENGNSDGYSRDIFFPGWIEQVDMPAVYSMAALLLYPSNLEAFPIPLTEAMACGTPIVTSNVNGLKEIAGEAAVLVDPKDAEAIRDAINRVLSDQMLGDKLAARGLARVKQFSWDVCASKTLSVLEEAAGSGRQ
jgi:glycosyltransferase involved in cell wall biosynthesis